MSLSDTFPLVDNVLELSFTLGRDHDAPPALLSYLLYSLV